MNDNAVIRDRASVERLHLRVGPNDVFPCAYFDASGDALAEGILKAIACQCMYGGQPDLLVLHASRETEINASGIVYTSDGRVSAGGCNLEVRYTSFSTPDLAFSVQRFYPGRERPYPTDANPLVCCHPNPITRSVALVAVIRLPTPKPPYADVVNAALRVIDKASSSS